MKTYASRRTSWEYSQTEAEKAVLACILLYPELVDSEIVGLTPEDFYHDQHQHLFRECTRIIREGNGSDSTTLQLGLPKCSTWAKIGGRETLDACKDMLHDPDYVRTYVDTVKDYSRKRTMQILLAEATENLVRKHHDPEIVAANLCNALMDQATVSHGFAARRIGDIATEYVQKLRSPNGFVQYATGFNQLDGVIGGLEPGRLYVIAGRPGSGKTSLALAIGLHTAEMEKSPVLMQSLEMNNAEQAKRMLSGLTSIPGNSFRPRNLTHLTGEEWAKVEAAVFRLTNVDFWIDDASNKTVSEIIGQARVARRKHNAKILIVDHGGLVKPSTENARKELRIQLSEMTRELKNLAKKEQFAVLCLFQLNREIEKRDKKRPRMSDLRESGQIEENADAIMLVHRPHLYDKGEDPDLAEIHVVKNRDGETAKVNLAFKAEYTRFEDYFDRVGPEDIPVTAMDAPY